jgi:hypothetical protein
MGTVARVVSWSGRILAIGIFAVWGAFFVEHLEWFVHPTKGLPPAWVWLLQLVHLALLAGLLALIRWEVAGSLLTIAATLVFFVAAARGKFPLFFGVTVLPAVLVLLGRLLRLRAAAPPSIP